MSKKEGSTQEIEDAVISGHYIAVACADVVVANGVVTRKTDETAVHRVASRLDAILATYTTWRTCGAFVHRQGQVLVILQDNESMGSLCENELDLRRLAAVHRAIDARVQVIQANRVGRKCVDDAELAKVIGAAAIPERALDDCIGKIARPARESSDPVALLLPHTEGSESVPLNLPVAEEIRVRPATASTHTIEGRVSDISFSLHAIRVGTNWVRLRDDARVTSNLMGRDVVVDLGDERSSIKVELRQAAGPIRFEGTGDLLDES